MDRKLPSNYLAIRAQHPRAYEEWQAQEDAWLLEEMRAGKGIAEISRALGRQPNAIRSRLRQLRTPKEADNVR